MKETEYSHRTDSISEKIQLLEDAVNAGNFHVAQSLAFSMKETLRFEQQQQPPATPATPDADTFTHVEDLPQAWASWANGWHFCKIVRVSEETGIAREREVIEFTAGFLATQVNDLRRELRVARIDRHGALVETVSQIYGETSHGESVSCQLLVQLDVASNESLHLLLFYGNSLAELPCYPSDLTVNGEGFGLDIANSHYEARLSRQMGQIERLTYGNRLGIELFAGGPGHGEPPNIDWAHDYLASNKFQKFRVTNWETCPNYEVIRGPLCVKVRRWGFPHSPAHPLFTPSRMHIDVTYSFMAGVPWFFKDGRMDMIKDYELNYLRDEEWVFSGYTFDECLWMDEHGSLHEGEVPQESQDALWGVGFYSKHSRDAFVALWLEHRAENFDGLCHSGAPILHYSGHGQLWSRWAARNSPQFKKGDALIQRNAYLTLPYPEDGSAHIEELRNIFLHPLSVTVDDVPSVNASCTGSLARLGETRDSAPLKPVIWDALREVQDTMFYTADANVVDMGYIYDLKEKDGVVQILMTMPHTGRPKYEFIAQPIKDRLLQLDGVRDVIINNTWEPAWNVNRMTPKGREAMELLEDS